VIGNLDGTNLPLALADLDVVYTSPDEVRLLAVGSGTEPALGVATWTTTSDNLYRSIAWDGVSAWSASEVLAAGVQFGDAATEYIYGLAYPGGTDDELIVAREDEGTHYLDRWVLTGTDWLIVERFEESTGLLIRPEPSIGGGFIYHTVDTYSDFDDYTGPAVRAVLPSSSEVPDHDHDADYAPLDHTHDAVIDETVFPPDYTVTDGTSLDLDVTFVWGISAGDPYYNAAGVTVGEEAVLVLDNSTGEFSLRPVEV
jgi:hypothetical protein